MMLMNIRNNRRSVFTVAQWQELDNQAQIFRYIVSGIPIPPDLIFYIKRSLNISSRPPPPPHHQPLGWSCFNMDFGRKPDPEPGRCRRTDGKKWRCSKEAFLDSKYCERHMHRGRNRSRKPVETIPTTTTKPLINIPSLMAAATDQNETHHHHNTTTTSTTLHPFLYTHSPTSRPQNNNTHLVLDSGSYSQSHKDHRYFHRLKEEESDKCDDFFTRSFSPPDPKKMRQSYSDFQSGGYSQFQQKHHHKEEQHCFVLGTDFKSKSNPLMKMEKREEEEEEPKQVPLRHFFDEWPLKSKESSHWLDLEENRSNQAYFSNTQLSISIPMSSSSNDFTSRAP